MSEKLFALEKKGGSGKATFTLIGQKTIASTTAQSLTLDESIDNYKYLLFSMVSFDNDGGMVFKSTLFAYPMLALVPVSYFKSNSPLSTAWLSGSASNIVARTCTITYVSDTSVTLKNDYTTSRTVYVYGLK